MSNETLRGNLVDSINKMTRLLEICPAHQRFELRAMIRELMQRLDRVLVATLDSATPEFAAAIASLHDLKKKAEHAKADLEEVAATIEQAAVAVDRLEEVVRNVVGVMAIT